MRGSSFPCAESDSQEFPELLSLIGSPALVLRLDQHCYAVIGHSGLAHLHGLVEVFRWAAATADRDAAPEFGEERLAELLRIGPQFVSMPGRKNGVNEIDGLGDPRSAVLTGDGGGARAKRYCFWHGFLGFVSPFVCRVISHGCATGFWNPSGR